MFSHVEIASVISTSIVRAPPTSIAARAKFSFDANPPRNGKPTMLSAPMVTANSILVVGIALLFLLNFVQPGSIDTLTRTPLGVMALAVVLSFVLTLLLGFEDIPVEEAAADARARQTTTRPSHV